MKRIHSKAALLKKRVRTIHGRAKFTGILYLLGTIALAAAAVLLSLLDGTAISTANGLLPVVAFGKEVVATVKGGFGGFIRDSVAISKTIVLVLYLILLIVALVNVLVALSKLGWLFKRRASRANGFNRNMYAMEDLGKCFSALFNEILVCWLFIYLFTAQINGSAPTVRLFGYIVLGGGLAIHLLGGLLEGSVSLFTTGDKLEESKRTNGVFVFFVRNLLQTAAVGAILYFFVPQTEVIGGFANLYDNTIPPRNWLWFLSNLKALVPFLVEVVAWVAILVLIKHATARTEYNRDCMHGVGINNNLVFSLIAAIAFAGILVLPKLGLAEAEALNKNILIAAIVAFVSFLLDCIIRPRGKKKSDEDEVEMEVTQSQQATAGGVYPQYNQYVQYVQQPGQAPQIVVNPATQPAQQPYQPIYQVMPPMQQPAPQQQGAQQPVYFPVYYPVPMQQPAAQPQEPVRPEPAPAPVYILPMPSPATQEREKEEGTIEEKPEAPLDPNKVWTVRCPQCGKHLNVRETSPYHRCPACDKVFQLRKFETYKRKED